MLDFSGYVKSIYEAVALDPEKLLAPRELWFTDELNEWYEDREKLRREQ